MNDKLATIQRVKNVRVHPGADALDLCDVLGWTVVTKKSEFKENDLCVYVSIDTILPEKPEFEFLRNKGFRIKPIRLRTEPSNGICFPLSIIPGFVAKTASENGCFRNWINETGGEEKIILEEGDDITDIMEVKKYEKPMPPELAGQAHGGLPSFLIMTDEDNLRSYPNAIPELFARPYYITRKDDGSSGTFFIKDNQ